MPFTSQKQRKACWAKYNRDKKEGKKPTWDCKKWESETPSWIPGMKKRSTSYKSAAKIKIRQGGLSFVDQQQKKVHYRLKYTAKERRDILDQVVYQHGKALSIYRGLIARRTMGKNKLSKEQLNIYTSDANYIKKKYHGTEFWQTCKSCLKKKKASRAYRYNDSSCSSSTSESESD